MFLVLHISLLFIKTQLMKLLIKIEHETLEFKVDKLLPLFSNPTSPVFLYSTKTFSPKTIDMLLNYHNVEFDNELFEKGEIYMLKLYDVITININTETETETVTINY